MTTHQGAAKKGVVIIFAQLLVVCIMCLPHAGFSRHKKGKKPVVQFGNVDSLATRAQLLANPHLKCNLPGCKVMGFAFSMLPAKGEFLGPYITSGGDELNGQAKQMISKLDKFPTKVFIGDIHVSINGVDRAMPGLTFVCRE